MKVQWAVQNQRQFKPKGKIKVKVESPNGSPHGHRVQMGALRIQIEAPVHMEVPRV